MGSTGLVRLLLDTHIWIWSLIQPERLTKPVIRALQREDAELWLSPISVWELVNLVDRGRIRLRSPVEDWIEEALRRVPLHEAPVTHSVAVATRTVKLSHPDPADRFLVATARVFGLRLVTADERLIDLGSVPTLPNR